jgi:hypothetical protein
MFDMNIEVRIKKKCGKVSKRVATINCNQIFKKVDVMSEIKKINFR